MQAGQVHLRSQVRNALQGAGFDHIGTSSFEAQGVPLPELAAAINAMVDRLSTSQLDHLWIYVDVPEEDVVDEPTDPLPTRLMRTLDHSLRQAADRSPGHTAGSRADARRRECKS